MPGFQGRAWRETAPCAVPVNLCFTRRLHGVKVGTPLARAKNKIRWEPQVAHLFLVPVNMNWDFLHEVAWLEVQATLAALPAPLQARARKLPVTYEAVPSPDLGADGIEADSLGLFTGPAFDEAEHSISPVPAQIILFLENLWTFAGGDRETYREEVHKTYLHELGHYLGLDEGDLTERGLD